MLNPDASPYAHWLVRPPRFPDIFEEDADAPRDNNRCQCPARHKRPLPTPTSASRPHVLVRPIPSPPTLLQASIVATIQVDIDELLLKQNKKRISRRQSGLSLSAAATRARVLLVHPPRAVRAPPRTPSLVFGPPLRCSAERAGEEDEYVAFHGHRQVDVDKDVCRTRTRVEQREGEAYISTRASGRSSSARRRWSRTRAAPYLRRF